MALSISTTRRLADPSGLAQRLVSAAQVYGGSFLGIRGPDHATSQGDVSVYDDDEKGLMFAGMSDTETLNATSGTSNARFNSEPTVYKGVSVTGASARTDVLKYCYLTDDDSWSLTRPTLGCPNGIIIDFDTVTFDVLTFGIVGQILLHASGAAQDIVHLGNYDWSGISDGNIRTAFPMAYHGEFLDIFAMVNDPMVGASGTTSLNLEIGGTNVTGGVVVVSTAAGGTAGTLLAGTAITAANVFHEGDTVDVEAASTSGTQTSGTFDLYATVLKKPGN